MVAVVVVLWDIGGKRFRFGLVGGVGAGAQAKRDVGGWIPRGGATNLLGTGLRLGG